MRNSKPFPDNDLSVLWKKTRFLRQMVSCAKIGFARRQSSAAEMSTEAVWSECPAGRHDALHEAIGVQPPAAICSLAPLAAELTGGGGWCILPVAIHSRIDGRAIRPFLPEGVCHVS